VTAITPERPYRLLELPFRRRTAATHAAGIRFTRFSPPSMNVMYSSGGPRPPRSDTSASRTAAAPPTATPATAPRRQPRESRIAAARRTANFRCRRRAASSPLGFAILRSYFSEILSRPSLLGECENSFHGRTSAKIPLSKWAALNYRASPETAAGQPERPAGSALMAPRGAAQARWRPPRPQTDQILGAAPSPSLPSGNADQRLAASGETPPTAGPAARAGRTL